MRSGSNGSYALTPAQGLERGRDGGEVKVMTVTRASSTVEEVCDISVDHLD